MKRNLILLLFFILTIVSVFSYIDIHAADPYTEPVYQPSAGGYGTIAQAQENIQENTYWLAILAALIFFLLSMNLLRLNRQRRLAAVRMAEDKRFQQLVADIASDFINVVADETDAVIHQSIRKCGEFFDVDRSCLIRFSDDQKKLIHEYEWRAEGIEPLDIQPGYLLVDRLPWLYRQILDGLTVHIDDVSAMPPEAAKDQKILTQQQVKSTFLLPISANQKVIACWGFNEITKVQHWEEKHVVLLQVLTTLFNSAYEKQLYERMQQSWQDLMQYIIRHDPNAVAVLDNQLHFLFVSQRFLDDYNVHLPNIIGKHYYEVFPDIPEKWRQVHRRVLKGAVESMDDDVIARKDGSTDYIKWEVRPWYLQSDTIGGIVLYTEIINERKNRELALQESEERFRMLVETAPDAILLYTGRELAYANQSAAELLGAADAETILGLHVNSHIHPDYHAAVEARDRLLLDEKQSTPLMEQKFIQLDGTSIDVEVTSAPIRYEDRDGMLVYVRDIAERKTREREALFALQQQRHQQKLEAIGLLASGVAHEINNPLTGIINYAQLIVDQQNTDDESALYADEIMTESRRISDIVHDLLHFSRHEKQAHSPADIKDIIHRTLTLVSAVMKRDQIDIQLHIPEALTHIKCRSQQIQQVMMNLLTNARDALNERYPGAHADKLLLITCTEFNENDRTWIRVTVEDHGNGVPAEIHEQLFNPFFTTKPKELGTGLGLPISYGIVKEHNGELLFETKQGQYTRFHLQLPADNEWQLEAAE